MYNKQKCEHVNPWATCDHNQDHKWNQCGHGKEEQNTKINYKLQYIHKYLTQLVCHSLHSLARKILLEAIILAEAESSRYFLMVDFDAPTSG